MDHTVLIVSPDAAEYEPLLRRAELPGARWLSATSTEAARPLVDQVEIMLGNPALIAPLLAAADRLRWVQSTWAGVGPLLPPDLRRDYQLTNMRGVFGSMMVEYVLGYLLQHERQIINRWQQQQAGVWDHRPPGFVRGKTIGIMGVGSIGSDVAELARTLGMTVWGYTRRSEACPHVDRYFHRPDLLAFAAGVDYVVAVMPDTADTRRLIDRSFLRAMKPTALLINAGRGSAIDEDALVEALVGERIAGAVLDVFREEPLPPDHPFWTAPRLLMSGHTAAPSVPAQMVPVFIDNYRRFVSGRPLQWVVDFELGY